MNHMEEITEEEEVNHMEERDFDSPSDDSCACHLEEIPCANSAEG